MKKNKLLFAYDIKDKIIDEQSGRYFKWSEWSDVSQNSITFSYQARGFWVQIGWNLS